MKSIKHPATPPHTLCLCSALKPGFYYCRIMGLLPIISHHPQGACVFKKCRFWLAFSIGMLIGLIVSVALSNDFYDLIHLNFDKPLHAILNSVSDFIYSAYIVVLTLFSIVRYPQFVRMFNRLQVVLKEGLLCESALKAIRHTQYAFIFFACAIFTTQFLAMAGMHFSDKFYTDFTFLTVMSRLTQNVTFAFYVLFMTLSSVFIGVLGCFEKLVANCLRYQPVHPTQDTSEYFSKGVCMGFKRYVICSGDHPCHGKLKLFTPVELVEHLRRLHEEICIVMYDLNGCLSPQLLCHFIVELAVLIVYWYSVVVYLVHNFESPIAITLYFLNVFFVVVHSLGLFLLLKYAQEQQNMVKRLTHFLLEYSTRISSPEEHQQVRLFVEKIRVHRPLNANGIFVVDLGIAAPIVANILTYVLVALQFDVPKS